MRPPSPWPDTRPSLLLQLRDRSAHEAGKVFGDTYHPLLSRYCRRHGLQDADAADVTSEVLKKVPAFMDRYDPGCGRFRGWLGTVTRREVQRFREKRDRPGR